MLYFTKNKFLTNHIGESSAQRLPSERCTLILDCSGLTFFDYTGLSVLTQVFMIPLCVFFHLDVLFEQFYSQRQSMGVDHYLISFIKPLLGIDKHLAGKCYCHSSMLIYNNTLKYAKWA